MADNYKIYNVKGAVPMTMYQGGPLEMVPREEVEGLVRDGWVPLDKQNYIEHKKREAEAEFYDRPVEAAARGFARGATFGLSDFIGDEEHTRKVKEYNPISGVVGEIGSLIVPGTGAAKAFKGASALGKAVAGGGASAGRKLLGGTTRVLTEGAMLGAGQGISNVALSEKAMTAEEALEEIFTNAKHGAAINAGLGAVGFLGRKGLGAIKDKLVAPGKKAAELGEVEQLIATEQAGLLGQKQVIEKNALPPEALQARMSELRAVKAESAKLTPDTAKIEAQIMEADLQRAKDALLRREALPAEIHRLETELKPLEEAYGAAKAYKPPKSKTISKWDDLTLDEQKVVHRDSMIERVEALAKKHGVDLSEYETGVAKWHSLIRQAPKEFPGALRVKKGVKIHPELTKWETKNGLSYSHDGWLKSHPFERAVKPATGPQFLPEQQTALAQIQDALAVAKAELKSGRKVQALAADVNEIGERLGVHKSRMALGPEVERLEKIIADDEAVRQTIKRLDDEIAGGSGKVAEYQAKIGEISDALGKKKDSLLTKIIASSAAAGTRQKIHKLAGGRISATGAGSGPALGQGLASVLGSVAYGKTAMILDFVTGALAPGAAGAVAKTWGAMSKVTGVVAPPLRREMVKLTSDDWHSAQHAVHGKSPEAFKAEATIALMNQDAKVAEEAIEKTMQWHAIVSHIIKPDPVITSATRPGVEPMVPTQGKKDPSQHQLDKLSRAMTIFQNPQVAIDMLKRNDFRRDDRKVLEIAHPLMLSSLVQIANKVIREAAVTGKTFTHEEKRKLDILRGMKMFDPEQLAAFQEMDKPQERRMPPSQGRRDSKQHLTSGQRMSLEA